MPSTSSRVPKGRRPSSHFWIPSERERAFRCWGPNIHLVCRFTIFFINKLIIANYYRKDATLREITDLIKAVNEAARRRTAKLSFAFVYPDVRGKNVMREVGQVWSSRKGDDDTKTLEQLRFEIGMFVSSLFVFCFLFFCLFVCLFVPIRFSKFALFSKTLANISLTSYHNANMT